MSRIAAALGKQVKEMGALTNIDDEFVVRALAGAWASAHRTNAQGQLLDVWGTPYQIKTEPPARFAIRSAGRNKQFGDADDIVFDGTKNTFTKP